MDIHALIKDMKEKQNEEAQITSIILDHIDEMKVQISTVQNKDTNWRVENSEVIRRKLFQVRVSFRKVDDRYENVFCSMANVLEIARNEKNLNAESVDINEFFHFVDSIFTECQDRSFYLTECFYDLCKELTTIMMESHRGEEERE